MFCRLDDPSGAAKEKLLLQLDALKNVKLSAGTAGDKNTASSGENVTYELLMKPETSKLDDQKRIAELDRRLEHLEKLLAYSPESMVRHREVHWRENYYKNLWQEKNPAKAFTDDSVVN